MLSTYLKGEAGKAFDARRAAVAAIKTPDDLARRQRELKGKFLEALGDLPEKTPLNARVVGVEARDGYRLERVIYESRPEHHVTALFYLPDGPPPFPAVLMPCGHDDNGKAAEAYQRGCILLARNGIAALCYDPIGQGERRQLLDADGKPAGPGNTTEHTLIGVGALLVGRSTAGYRVWDGIRSLDYLASRPEVDPRRLGCTGCSGGGTLTSYLMALDDRVAAAAPSCYITSLERLFATLGPQDAEQNITGQVAFGLDHADYLGLRAPRPTLVLSSTPRLLRPAGDLDHLPRGEAGPTACSATPSGWTSSRPTRRTATPGRTARRWPAGCAAGSWGRTTPPAEGETTIAKDADLLCTRSGQVLADLRGKSVFDLNAEREAELARRRAESAKAARSGRAARGGPPPDRPPRADRAGRARGPGGGQVGAAGPCASWSSRPSRGSRCRPGSSRPAKADARRAAGRGGRLRRGRGGRPGRAGRGPAQGGPARAGGRPPGDGRDGPRRGEARAARRRRAGGVPLAPPRPPPARAAGRRPALGARRPGRTSPPAGSRSSATGPPGRSPCTRRRSSRGSSR